MYDNIICKEVWGNKGVRFFPTHMCRHSMIILLDHFYKGTYNIAVHTTCNIIMITAFVRITRRFSRTVGILHARRRQFFKTCSAAAAYYNNECNSESLCRRQQWKRLFRYVAPQCQAGTRGLLVSVYKGVDDDPSRTIHARRRRSALHYNNTWYMCAYYIILYVKLTDGRVSELHARDARRYILIQSSLRTVIAPSVTRPRVHFGDFRRGSP